MAAPSTPPVEGVTYLRADISRIDQLLALLNDHDVSGIALLSYMMGQLMSPQFADILQACQVNVTGITSVLEAARLAGVRRIAFLSTVGTYGPQVMYGERPVTEDEILAPASMYGRMKALNESICDRYAALYGLEVVKVRPSSILGPGSTIWPSRFIERIAVGETGLVPYGESARDNVIAVDDLADAVRSIIPDARIEFPTPERRPSYPGTFDNSRAVTEFGWAITGLQETVRAHIDGVRAEAGLSAVTLQAAR